MGASCVNRRRQSSTCDGLSWFLVTFCSRGKQLCVSCCYWWWDMDSLFHSHIKQAIVEWKHHGLPRKKKYSDTICCQSAGHHISGLAGHVAGGHPKPGCTFNASRYCTTLESLWEAIRRKHPGPFNSGEFSAKVWLENIEPSTYSLDLASKAFLMFSTLRENFWRHFICSESVKHATVMWLMHQICTVYCSRMDRFTTLCHVHELWRHWLLRAFHHSTKALSM